MKKTLLIAIVCSTLVMALQMVLPSMINEYLPFWSPANTEGVIDNTFLQEVYVYHRTLPVFAARPLVTWLITVVHRIGVSISFAFVLVEWGLLVTSGLALAWFARQWVGEKRFVLPLALYYTSFSVLFAFFAPTYTYDDLLQYTLLFLALGFAYTRRWWRFVLWMTLALWCREPSILLLPSVAILWVKQKYDWKTLFYIILPVMLYVVVQRFFLNAALVEANAQYLHTERFAHWLYNTQSRERIWETIWSIMAVWTLPLYVLFRTRYTLSSKYTIAVVLSWIVNTVVALVATRIQESRIVALPLVLIWPVLAAHIRSIWQASHIRITILRMVSLAVGVFLCVRFVYATMVTTDANAFLSIFHLYMIIVGIGIMLHASIFVLDEKRQNTHCSI